MSSAGQSDAVTTDDSSASAPAETSAEAQPTSASAVVTSASAAESTSAAAETSSEDVPSGTATSAEATSAAETSQAATTQVSSSAAAATTSEKVESTTSAAATQATSAAVTTQPAASATNVSTSDNNNNSSSQDDPATTEAVSSKAVQTTVIVTTGSEGTSSIVVYVTSTTTGQGTGVDDATSATSTSDSPALGGSGDSSSGGLSQGSKVAIGVVVPIAAIAILALVGLFWWKKRRSRKQAAEERRKEVEDYAYNPNADPTVPSVMGDGYEMREDASGYRGWGSTTVSSAGRKASTTMSGGQIGQAYSDVASPTTTHGNASDRTQDPLMGSYSPEGEILGAMGPNAANNRGGADVHRGPSNASSSYSAARSEGSDTMGPSYAGGAYYDQYAQNNPYGDAINNGQPPSAPVIRDNPARRNTRIENPSHYPQQSAGISQNF